MNRLPLRLGFLAVGLVAFVGVYAVAAPDDPKPEPVAAIKDIMNGVNNPQGGLYGLIKETLKADAPTDKDWKLVGVRAVIMAEAGNLLMGLTPPRGADDAAGQLAWRKEAAAYRECAKGLRKAAALKNIEQARAAMDSIKQRCDACHEAHQPE
jgi:hypothetical protein